MNNSELNNMTTRKKQLFNDSLDILSNITVKNPNSTLERNLYRDRFISHLEGFYAKTVDRITVIRALEGKIGSKAFCKNVGRKNILNKSLIESDIAPKNFRFNYEIYLDDTYFPNYYTNEQMLVHEMNHADTYLNTKGNDQSFYTGLIKLSTNSIAHGEALNEAVNELYTQVAFFKAHPEVYTNINSVDDILYKPVLPEYNSEELYRARMYHNLGYVAKLLLIACDNDMGISYDALEKNNNNFFNKKIFLSDHKFHFKNDLIHYGKYDGEEFEKKFDFLTEEGKFVELLDSFEEFLRLLKSSKDDTTVDYYKGVITKIISQIDEYKENKYSFYHQKGIWNDNQLYYNESRYDEYKNHLCSTFDINLHNKKALTL